MVGCAMWEKVLPWGILGFVLRRNLLQSLMTQAHERGSGAKRKLDRWVGIPLVAAIAATKKARGVFAPPFPPASAINSIGVLSLGAIGDLLLASGLLNGLHRELPHAKIEVTTSKANAECGGLLGGVYTFTSFAVNDFWGISTHLRSRNYDLLIDLGQWPRFSALLAGLSCAKRTVGFATAGQWRHFAFDYVVPHSCRCHETENFLKLGQIIFPNLKGNVAIDDIPEPGERLQPEGRGIVFCHMWPSGFRAYLKEWPPAYWAELAAVLMDGGYVPVFTGGPNDRARTELFLHENVPGRNGLAPVSIAGKATLRELVGHMKAADAVVSVNTGIMHLAAIAGAPTIALHGPTDPVRWGPVGPKTCTLLPRSGTFAYLNLGFEYPSDAEGVLKHLPVSDVCAALRDMGVVV